MHGSQRTLSTHTYAWQSTDIEHSSLCVAILPFCVSILTGGQQNPPRQAQSTRTHPCVWPARTHLGASSTGSPLQAGPGQPGEGALALPAPQGTQCTLRPRARRVPGCAVHAAPQRFEKEPRSHRCAGKQLELHAAHMWLTWLMHHVACVDRVAHSAYEARASRGSCTTWFVWPIWLIRLVHPVARPPHGLCSPASSSGAK